MTYSTDGKLIFNHHDGRIVGEAATKEDAEKIAADLNAEEDGTAWRRRWGDRAAIRRKLNGGA